MAHWYARSFCQEPGYKSGFQFDTNVPFGGYHRSIYRYPPKPFRLVNLGYLEYDRYDSTLLTEKGKEFGAYLLKRHDIVEHFGGFIRNSAPLEEAELVEHSLEPATVSFIARFWNSFCMIVKRKIVMRHSGKKRRPRALRSPMS